MQKVKRAHRTGGKQMNNSSSICAILSSSLTETDVCLHITGTLFGIGL